MRISLLSLTLLLLGALSMGSALAENAGRDSSSAGNNDSSRNAIRSGKGGSSSATSSTSSGTTDAGSGTKDVVGKDNDGNAKATGDESNKGRGNAAVDNSGHNRTPKLGKAGGNAATEGGKSTVPTIDTRVIVNQGRGAKTSKKLSLKDKILDPKLGAVSSARDQGSKEGQRNAAKQPSDGTDRNAIGVKVDQGKFDKSSDRRNATGVSVLPMGATVADLRANATTQPPSGSVSVDPNTQRASDHAQVNRTNTTQMTPTASTVRPTNGQMAPGTSTISGTGLIRPVMRTGMITGAPKPGAAVISGNNTAARH